MDCLQSLLNQIQRIDAEFCTTYEEFGALLDYRTIRLLHYHLPRLNTRRKCCSRRICSAFYGDQLVVPCGSAAEGGVISRGFGVKEDRLEIEIDFMVHIGTVSNVQLISCSRLGYYKLTGFVDVRTVIPDACHSSNGLENFVSAFANFLMKKSSFNGYISAALIKSLIDHNTKVIIDGTKIFGELFSRPSRVSPNAEFHMSPVKHGPAIMWTFASRDADSIIKLLEIDGVVSLGIKEWPDIAMAWISRDRIWPTMTVVEKIISDGCGLVGKEPDWDHSEEGECDAAIDAHWRISFSLAEKHLAKARSGTQNYCYFAFKSIFYFKFSGNLRTKQMSSYLAKTVFLWTCEWLDFDLVEQKDIIVELFVALRQYLRINHLPHYFVPEINLIQNMSDDDRRAIIDTVTVTIHELSNSDRKLLSELRRIGVILLKNTKLMSVLVRRLLWRYLCDIIVGQSTFLNHLSQAERLLAVASDLRVIGFGALVTYFASNDRLDELPKNENISL